MRPRAAVPDDPKTKRGGKRSQNEHSTVIIEEIAAEKDVNPIAQEPYMRYCTAACSADGSEGPTLGP